MANLLSTIINGYLANKDFKPGFDGSGWKIWEWATGRYKLEVDDLTVRGTMTVFELIISKIRALMGAMAITQANGKIKSVREDVSYYYLEIEDDMSFVEHDIIRCQTFNKNNLHGYWVEIAEVTGKEIKISKDEFTHGSDGVIADPPREDDELVQFGNSSKNIKYAGRHSAIYLSADETGQPCIDVLQGIYTKSFEGCMKLRVGCLDGINDTDFPEGVRDFGIYCVNGYFKGNIAGAGGYMLRSNGSGYIAGGAISWSWDATKKKWIVKMSSDVVLQWNNLSEETRNNLKGKDGRDGINGLPGRKGDPGRDADIVFPWLEEWQSNATTINGESVISPKMFAGSRDGTTGKLTGVLFGKCISVNGKDYTGIVSLVDDEIVFAMDPVTKMYTFKGRIEADDGDFKKGKIGWFHLVDGNLIGYDNRGIQRVAFTQSPIPSVGDLYEGEWYCMSKGSFDKPTLDYFKESDSGYSQSNCYPIDDETDDFNMYFGMGDDYNYGEGWINPAYCAYKVPFRLDVPGTIAFNFSKSMSDGWKNEIENYSSISLNGDKYIKFLYSGEGYLLDPGNYYLEVYLGYNTMNRLPDEGTYAINLGISIESVKFRRIHQCTIVGSDGLVSRFGANKYLSFKDGEGFEVKYGTHGIKINNDGVYKTSNGNDWHAI